MKRREHSVARVQLRRSAIENILLAEQRELRNIVSKFLLINVLINMLRNVCVNVVGSNGTMQSSLRILNLHTFKRQFLSFLSAPDYNPSILCCFRVLELEAALLDTEAPSASDIYAICKGQPVPANLRPDVWLACLYVTDRGDQLSQFNEVYDLPEQNVIRDDCQQLVGECIEKIVFI